MVLLNGYQAGTLQGYLAYRYIENDVVRGFARVFNSLIYLNKKITKDLNRKAKRSCNTLSQQKLPPLTSYNRLFCCTSGTERVNRKVGSLNWLLPWWKAYDSFLFFLVAPCARGISPFQVSEFVPKLFDDLTALVFTARRGE